MPQATKRIAIDLNAELYDRYEALASKQGLKLTAWIRQVLDRVAAE